MSGWRAGDLTTLGRRAASMERHRLAMRADSEAILATVDALREAGCPWSLIGQALGVTRQAAQQRYGR